MYFNINLTKLLWWLVLFAEVIQAIKFNHFMCHQKCKDAKLNDITFYKSSSSEYRRCSDTTACFETGSEIFLNTSENYGLYLENQGVLEVFANATLRVINEKGFCKISGRSYLMVGDSLIINSAHFSAYSSSEVLNWGKIELEPNSKFYIASGTQVKLSPEGNVHMGYKAELNMFDHSVVQLFHEYSNRKDNQEILMKNESKIYLPKSAIVSIISGGITMIEKSRLHLYNQGLLTVDGYIEIGRKGEININNQGEIHVGFINRTGDVTSRDLERLTGDGNSSLLIGEDSFIYVGEKRKLLVKKGAHCVVRKGHFLSDDTTLDSSTKNTVFNCFSNKNDLMDAVKNITIS